MPSSQGHLRPTLAASGARAWQEWIGFWDNVIKHGYKEDEALEELENLEKGESWVDFDDGRNT